MTVDALWSGNLDEVYHEIGLAMEGGGTLSDQEVMATLMNLSRSLHNQIEYTRFLERRVMALESASVRHEQVLLSFTDYEGP